MQRLVVLIFGVTAFGTMHQSAEFILLALFNQARSRRAALLGPGHGTHPRPDRCRRDRLTLWTHRSLVAHEVSVLG